MGVLGPQHREVALPFRQGRATAEWPTVRKRTSKWSETEYGTPVDSSRDTEGSERADKGSWIQEQNGKAGQRKISVDLAAGLAPSHGPTQRLVQSGGKRQT